MICRNCGGNIESDSRFCPLCGFKLEKPAEPAAAAPEMPSEIKPEVKTEAEMVIAQDEPVVHESMTAPADKPAPEPAREMPRGDVPPVKQQRPPLPDDRVVTRAPSYAMCRTQGDYMGARQMQPVRPAKEKGFFGVGAFVLCVVMIGLLAISTGVFAFLYFSAIGVI